MAWVLETVRPWVTCFRSTPMKSRLEHLHWLRRRPGSPRPLSLETGQLMSSVVEAYGFYFSEPHGSFEWCGVCSTYPLFFHVLSMFVTGHVGLSQKLRVFAPICHWHPATFSDAFLGCSVPPTFGPGNCINGCGFGKASIGSEWKLRHDVEQLRYLARWDGSVWSWTGFRKRTSLISNN